MQFNVVWLLLMIVSCRIIALSDQDIGNSVAFHEGLEHLTELLGVLNTTVSRDGEGDEKPLTPAQDRQLIVLERDEFDLNFVEAKYSQLMESMPSLIDEAGAVVSKAVATSNMLGFTLVGGFITGAVLDSLALLMLNPNSLSHAVTLIVTDKYYQGVLHWLWWYAFGFSGPFLFPGTFVAGSPSLGVSSSDYFSLVSAHNLTLGIQTFTQLSPAKAKLRIEKIRRDFSVTFRPITSRRKYVETELLTETFNQMLSLVSFHSQLSPGPPARGEGDEFLLDAELSRLWSELAVLEEEARTEIRARRAETATIKIFIALLNLGGMIGGIVLSSGLAKERLGEEELSENLSDIPAWLLQSDPPRTSKHVRSLGAAALVMAPICWGYSYIFPYLLFLQSVEPSCPPGQQIYAKLVGLVLVVSLLSNSVSQVRGAQVSGKYSVTERRQQGLRQVEAGHVVEGGAGRPPLSPQHRGGFSAGSDHPDVPRVSNIQDRILAGSSLALNIKVY